MAQCNLNRMKSLAARLVAFRDRNQWTNSGLAEFLSLRLGRKISVRNIENWIQGRKPHAIWRRHVEEAIK